MGCADVRLSQCMIVKNEETNIERALSWGKDIVYEQIVVDTGSTDRTVELARAMGAKVYDFEWIDDFAAAKNYAISKASGEWIAFLDADEYFPPEEAEKLMPLLNQLARTRYYVMLTSWMHVNRDEKIFAGGVQTRIFKRMEGLRYKKRIHEELELSGGSIVDCTVDASNELAIFHSGYDLSSSEDKQKGERNARLILMELEEHPDDYDMMGYLGDAYYSIRDNNERAEEWYRKSIDRMPAHIDEYDVRSAVTFWKLMTILYKKNDEQAMMEIYDKAIRLIPKESDYDYVAGKFYVAKQDFKKGAYHLARALQILDKHGSVNRGELLTGNLQGTWELLAMCHYQNGDLDQCVKCCTALLKADRYLMSTLVMMLCAFKWDEERDAAKAAKEANAAKAAKAADAADVAMFLGTLYDMNRLKDRIFILRAAMKADYGNLVKVVRGTCSQEELQCFDQSMEQRGTHS